MADFLLELLSEEIPARMQAKARNDLARLFAECTGEAGLKTGAIDTHSTPRRLVLIARDVAEATEASREEVKGPRTSAPPQALEGFLRKTGLTRDQLEERDGVYFAVIERAGPRRRRNACRHHQAHRRRLSLAQVDALGRRASCAGCGRCTASSRSSARTIVPVEIDGHRLPARRRVGHRFHHPGPITIGGARDYVEKLRACHVIVDQEERERMIREGAEAAAAAAGLTLARRRRAGGRECRADRMAGAAARPLRPRIPRRAARGDRPHHAHQPEIFRLHQRRGAACPGVRLRRQHRRERRRRGDRRGQCAGARRAPRRRPLLLGAGPQGSARGAGEEARRHRLPREARHRRRQGRAGRQAGALAGREAASSKPTPIRSNAPRGSPRPISSPAWSASSRSFRA